MPRFSYKAVAADGEVVEGELEATSREAVVERLHAQGHVPIRAEERSPERPSGSLVSSNLWRRSRPARADLALFTREMATLLQAGLPLDRALAIMQELGATPALQALVEEIREAVRGGRSLAAAMEARKDTFPNYYVGMVRAGEAGGSLDGVLARLAETLERGQQMRENVRAALRYPILVVLMAAISLFVLMTFVIPEFRPLFEGSGTEMPLSTRIVIGVSDFLAAFWWALLLVVVGAAVAVRRYRQTPEGRMRWDAWMIGAPLIGDLTTKIEVARFSRTLGTLLANGVSVLNAMAMTAEVLENRVMAGAVSSAQGRLAKGEGLAEPLAESGVFPGLALHLVRVGEETGRLDAMLMRIADIYDEEVARSIQRLLSLLVPAVTLGLGVLIAGIIGSMMSAIMSAYDLPF